MFAYFDSIYYSELMKNNNANEKGLRRFRPLRVPALLKAFLVRSVLCPGPFGCGEQAGRWGSPAVGGASSGVGAAVAGRAGRTMGVHRTWQLEIRDVTGPVWTLGTQDPAEPRPRGEAGRAEGSASLRTAEAGEWQEGGWGRRLCLEAEGLRRWNRGAGCCRLTAGRGPPGAREPDAGGCPESAEGSGRGEGASEGTGIGNDIEVSRAGAFCETEAADVPSQREERRREEVHSTGTGGPGGGKDGAALLGTLVLLGGVGGHGFRWEGMPQRQGARHPAALEQVARGCAARRGGGRRGVGLGGRVRRLQARAGLWASGRPAFVWLCQEVG